ncbi:MAG: 30S ribosomal protein S20 [Alphaproteobacteria bacterium 16-39-46]|nr:MAG: 30S ribosomal protein S20 [Alphaproteobacteria bacterium 16-39-46]OZA43374.1 MAG: 30S ribosomal protein S20 [Alphaproteobacteria bacterium 17-39-52]HQS83903.1 30S ribosomal protein S20 [Alphaproteobacteria bacterium]HQS93831.1 30S ribosomal protein S20 [Alphaproteobacteria bacterium]
MANHKSAEKAIRQTERRTEENRSYRNRIRTFVRKVELALTAKNKEEAAAAFKPAESHIMKGVAKGFHHKNTAARKISRLSKRIKAL